MRRQFRNSFKNNPLLKVASQNSAGILVKLFTGVATSKIIAVFIGPSGMAFLGNLKNTQNVLNKFSTAGLEEGAIRYCSEYKNKRERLSSFVSTLFFIGICVTVLLGLILYFGSSFWNDFIFPGRDFQYIFKLLAFILPLSMFNFFCLAILKGIEEFKKVIVINILTNILNLLLMGVLVWQFGLDGALITLAVLPSAVLFLTLSVANKKLRLISSFKLGNVSRIFGKNLSQYALMMLISGIVFPVVYVLIRNFIIDTIGLKEAGYWEALTRMSNYYLLFVMSLLSLYVLPKLSGTNTDSGFRDTIFNFYKTILPVFAVGLLVVYLLRFWIVKIIFSEEFLPMTELFLWQLVGDFLRVIALVMSYQLRAKKMVWKFIVSELFLAGLTYLSSIFLIDKIGLEGVTMAYAIAWALYGVVILFIFRKVFFYKWYR